MRQSSVSKQAQNQKVDVDHRLVLHTQLFKKGVQIFTHVVTQTKHSLNPIHRVGTSGGLKKANYLGWQGVATLVVLLHFLLWRKILLFCAQES